MGRMPAGFAFVFVAVAAFAPPRPVAGNPAPVFPQVKVDRVDARDPGDLRLFVTAMDEGGEAMDLREADVSVFLGPGGQALATSQDAVAVRFVNESRTQGKRGEARALVAAGVDHAVVLVVALHAEVPADERAALPRVLAACLEGIEPGARVGLVLYGDGLQVLAAGADGSPVFRDLNDDQHCLGVLRREADPTEPREPGVTCGRLFQGPEAVLAAVETLPASQGLFPRLLGIPESGSTMASAAVRGHDRVDRPLAAGSGDPFAEGAVEAGLRMLAAGTEPGSVRDLVLISDGRDGYLRFADTVWDGVASDCMKASPECRRTSRASEDPTWEAAFDHEGGSPRCSRAVVDCAAPLVNRVLRDREQVVRDRLVRLVGWARAADTRILALGLPSGDAVGVGRLKGLALASGGTWRTAPDAATLAKTAAAALGRELGAALVIRPGIDLEPGAAYQVAVRVNRDLLSLPYPFVAGQRTLPFAGAVAAGRSFAIARLGHVWGPPAFWAVLVLAVLAAIGMLFLLGKGIVALGKKLVGKGPKKPKAPAKPAMPKLKRPEA